jgi:hypothetical protein
MNLPEDVFQAAREASFKALNEAGYSYSPEWSGWRIVIKTAADHLPGKLLEPPTPEEIGDAVETIEATTGKRYGDLATTILRDFVDRRNAPPAPPDWRIEPIISILCKMSNDSVTDCTQMTDAIIAALDAAEGKKG